MFNPRELVSLFKDKDISKKEFRKEFYKNYLRSADFYGWLFNPSNDQLKDHANITNEIYDAVASSDRVLKMIIMTVDHYGVTDLGRSTSVFFSNCVAYAVDAVNNAMKKAEDDFREKAISRRECEDRKSAIKDFSKLVDELNDISLDIVKRDASAMKDATGVPKWVCKCVLRTVPDPEFISSAAAKVYVSSAISLIYQELSQKDADSIEDIYWSKFFDFLVGKSNRNEAAICIAVEGTSRNGNGELKGKGIKRAWASLTEFALDVLEKADPSTRSKMVEIYIKNLKKDVADHGSGLRVNLKTLDKRSYPKLTETAEQYRKQLDEVYAA